MAVIAIGTYRTDRSRTPRLPLAGGSPPESRLLASRGGNSTLRARWSPRGESLLRGRRAGVEEAPQGQWRLS